MPIVDFVVKRIGQLENREDLINIFRSFKITSELFIAQLFAGNGDVHIVVPFEAGGNFAQ
jgi:hypothetical protein